MQRVRINGPLCSEHQAPHSLPSALEPVYLLVVFKTWWTQSKDRMWVTAGPVMFAHVHLFKKRMSTHEAQRSWGSSISKVTAVRDRGCHPL